ncbi:hypothetical protein [uncultured Sphaerochaeta sp.]|uniref:hypothetical protein n=1 Tax=uncultured Sphaerochaeta sp. TaxID=886478 RepID=UPI0029CA8057|nr:hypothetical protein [uncultured Sphaerochaeta sp.]
MKKNHILTSITLTLLLSFMLLSCNADATAGLFRQISESKAPVGIVYKQIVGLDTTAPRTLYYLTSEGLFSTDGTSSTKLVANEEGNIIQSAYVDTTGGEVVFQTNDGTKKLYRYNISTELITELSGFTTNERVLLLANGLVLTKDATSTYKLFDYDVPASEIATTGAVNGYDLVSVLQLSGKEHMGVSATNPLLITLVNTSGDYKHFYVDDPTTGDTSVIEMDESTKTYRFASMAAINSDVYLLTTDGKLYAASTPSAATFNLMHDTNESYNKHAFMYATSDDTTTRLITKPEGINEPLYVINFPDTTVTDTASVTYSTIREGYGVYLDAAEIVDSYEKSANVLLVATLENGMYEIDIAGDTSSETEAYTL